MDAPDVAPAVEEVVDTFVPIEVAGAEPIAEATPDLGGSMFPPTAAEMAAMSTTETKTSADSLNESDTAKSKLDLRPKNYAIKKTFSMLGKLAGVLVLGAILIGGFLFWNRLKDTALVTELAEGQCVTEFFSPAEGEFRNIFAVETTDCVNQHAYEVFAVSESVFAEFSEELAAPAAAYEGIEQTFSIGEQYCRDRYDDFVGGDFVTSPWQVWTFVPTELRWENGDRRVQCLVGDAAEVLLTEGTLRDAGRE